MIKKTFKIAGIALGALVLLAGTALIVVGVRGIPHYQAKPPTLSIERTPERVERGKKLSALMCAGCHENPSTHRLTGKQLSDLPPVFGKVFSVNITQHPVKGIGGWTDGELAYLLRTGITRDGRYLPPWMIKLPHTSDEDLASIIAYLRSDDPAVAAADVGPAGTTKPSLLAKVLTNTVMKPLPYPDKPIVAPPRTDRVAFGRYLATSLDCFSCHSADFKKVDILHPEKSAGFLAGGNPLVGVEGRTVRSANLTPDDETGIGRWSEHDFVRALREGFRPDGRALRYPMLPKTELTQDEASAIYTYLRTVPAIHNEVRREEEKPTGNPSAGRKLYAQYGCTGCHGEGGAGADGVPDLHHVGAHFKTDTELRAWIENPTLTKPDTKMPVWKNIIAEEDYAPLIAYVRSLGPASPGAATGGELAQHN
jgi:mono/diheme cytochrome c family protein